MMRKNVVLPFRSVRNGSDAVRAGSWYQHSGQTNVPKWLAHGDHIDDWSYDAPLSLGREIRFDSETLLDELDLQDCEPIFELLHIARISSLGLRQILHRETLELSSNHTSRFEVILDSNKLCEEVGLSSSLVLKETLKGAPPWSPSTRGAICWGDDTKITLEGSGSRFPMQERAFSQHHKLPNSAAWHLDWRPGLLHYSFNSAVTLLLNSERTEFFKRIQEGDEILVEQVMSAITGEICAHLLAVEDFIRDDVGYPEGSLGFVVRTWLLQAMPGKSLADIGRAYDISPSGVHTALRGLAGRL